MIALFWVLNFVISIFNAFGCGKSWNESKAAGGIAHFLNWCGAIMAACGFTWCSLVIFGWGASSFTTHQADGTVAPLLSPDALLAFAQLGYLVLILPVLGTGLAITIHSWSVFWRRRTFADGTVTGWNTFAQVYNTVHAAREVPGALSGVFDFFGDDSDSDSHALVIALVLAAAFIGIAATYWIINAVAKSTAHERYYQRLRTESA